MECDCGGDILPRAAQHRALQYNFPLSVEKAADPSSFQWSLWTMPGLPCLLPPTTGLCPSLATAQETAGKRTVPTQALNLPIALNSHRSHKDLYLQMNQEGLPLMSYKNKFIYTLWPYKVPPWSSATARIGATS